MLYILLGIAGLFAALALFTDRGEKDTGVKEKVTPPVAGECCGMHAFCGERLERAAVPVSYFEDYELDLYRKVPADAYTDEQIDAFREVLYTLKADEVGEWLDSLEKREINLPEILRPEAIEMLS